MSYNSVLMQLSDTGNVITQARVTSGEDEAFRARVVLPRWKWIRLDCYIQDSKCWVSFWNTCKILKDGSFPAGKL
ncbi:hypothetical protein Q5P01_016383 [Channa striata]|uniref:Uncharacterized protein n=1 Tax=Channa striata TaxID=64152 RepID=A0AA88SE11_CHASR|nr:hypothetical protein Q5P01_016383 [Channa striata]